MSWVIVLIVIVFSVGIAYLGGSGVSKNRPRKDLMDDFARLVDGKIENTEGFENSYRIRFDFEGHDFVYEDVEMQGFNDKVYKTYLKINCAHNLTLTFGEKRTKKLIGNENELVPGHVLLPKALSEFGANSNRPDIAANFLVDPKVVKIYRNYRNVDSRGKAFFTLKIADGTIVLECDSTGKFTPKPMHYLREASAVEHYLDQLIYIKKAIESIKV